MARAGPTTIGVCLLVSCVGSARAEAPRTTRPASGASIGISGPLVGAAAKGCRRYRLDYGASRAKSAGPTRESDLWWPVGRDDGRGITVRFPRATTFRYIAISFYSPDILPARHRKRTCKGGLELKLDASPATTLKVPAGQCTGTTVYLDLGAEHTVTRLTMRDRLRHPVGLTVEHIELSRKKPARSPLVLSVPGEYHGGFPIAGVGPGGYRWHVPGYGVWLVRPKEKARRIRGLFPRGSVEVFVIQPFGSRYAFFFDSEGSPPANRQLFRLDLARRRPKATLLKRLRHDIRVVHWDGCNRRLEVQLDSGATVWLGPSGRRVRARPSSR